MTTIFSAFLKCFKQKNYNWAKFSISLLFRWNHVNWNNKYKQHALLTMLPRKMREGDGIVGEGDLK